MRRILYYVIRFNKIHIIYLGIYFQIIHINQVYPNHVFYKSNTNL